MRTPVGEVGFLHSLPFWRLRARGLVDDSHPSGMPSVGGVLVVVDDHEPRDRAEPSPEPSEGTRRSVLRRVERGDPLPDWWVPEGAPAVPGSSA